MNEKVLRNTFIVCAIIVALCAFYGVFRGCIRNDGERIDDVREKLSDVENTARDVTRGIGNAEHSAGRIRTTSKRIESIVAESGSAITDSEQILRGIRQRGKVEIASSEN